MAARVKLTEAQRRVLMKAPDDWERWQPMHRIPSTLLNPTMEALERKGFVEFAYVPPRWRITPSGRQAISPEEKDNAG